MNRQEIENDISFLKSYYFGLNELALPQEERQQLERHSVVLKLAKKGVLYVEGEMTKGVYILIKGKIKISRLNPDGSEQIYFIYTKGDIFGFRTSLSSGNQTDSAIAMEECEFRFIDNRNFHYIYKNSHYLPDILLEAISKEHSTLAGMVNLITKKSIRERTVYYLLILNEKFKKPGQLYEETEITMTRNDLASYVGSSLENLVRTLKELKDKNFIKVDGKSIYINDFDSLYALLGLHVSANRLTGS